MQLDLNPSGRLLVQVKYFQQASGGKKIVIIIIIIVIQFENINNFHTQLGSDFYPEMKSLHISMNTAHSGCKPSSFMSSFILNAIKSQLKTVKNSLCSLSFKDTSHIHLPPSALTSSYADSQPSLPISLSPICQRTLDTSSIHLSSFVI